MMDDCNGPLQTSNRPPALSAGRVLGHLRHRVRVVCSVVGAELFVDGYRILVWQAFPYFLSRAPSLRQTGDIYVQWPIAATTFITSLRHQLYGLWPFWVVCWGRRLGSAILAFHLANRRIRDRPLASLSIQPPHSANRHDAHCCRPGADRGALAVIVPRRRHMSGNAP
jgi:hypothetical protein